MLRPQACRWFELIGLRDELAPLLATLAQGGAVELQAHDQPVPPLHIADVAPLRARVRELTRSDAALWPPPAARAGAVPVTDPATRLAEAVVRLEAWHRAADPLRAESERLQAVARQDADLARWLAADAAQLPAPALLVAGEGGFVAARLYALPARVAASELPAGLLSLGVDDDTGALLMLVGRGDELARADVQLRARQARAVDWPAELGGTVADARAQLALRRDARHVRQRALDAGLQALAAQHALADALADIALVEWLLQQGPALAASDRLVWVSGWTSAPDAATLCAPLHRAGLRCVARFGAAPTGIEPPSLLHNPPWTRAFEAFARLLGQPGRDEADPTPVLAMVAPLLFGFMFGDVGQGAVLCLAGWWLRRRVPTLALLVPGGLMAMVFGLLFGSVFAREDLLPALWLHPLQQPVTLLLAALALGAAILLTGLLLNALQAAWRGALGAWVARDAPLLLAYAGALLAPWQPAALWALAVAALWAAVGGLVTAEGRRGAALAGALAHVVEQALQLAVNTVSFARVGAFALAHAGLSVAVVGVAEAVGGLGYGVVLVLGNGLILLLEGLVVGIQTTRLLLFEFFVRFLQGRGRAFRPLAPPPLVPT
jgi:V/A-type H+-transporting ATPase subunit I